MEHINIEQLSSELDEVIYTLDSITNDLQVEDIDIDKSELLGGPIDNIRKAIDTGNYIVGKYNEVVSKGGIFGDGKQVLIDEINKMKGVFRADKIPNGPKGPDGPEGRDYNNYNPGRASKIQAAGAKPIDVHFDTGIKAPTYGDRDFNADHKIHKYPVILSRQILDFSKFYKEDTSASGDLVPNSNSIMANYINTMVSELSRIAQANVNYSVTFSYKEITVWLTTLCECLNAFYGIYSFIQFANPENANEGMQFARRNISAEDYNILDVFTQDLEASPIPHNLRSLFYMLNANYRFEELPKSSIIKFTSANIGEDGILNFGIPELLKKLNDPGFKFTTDKIFRAIPEWRVFPNSSLDMYGPETYHSRNFNTLFINSGFVLKDNDGLYRYLPSFDSTQDGCLTIDRDYRSNTNELDGLVTSLYAIYDNAYVPGTSENLDGWVTGLLKPESFTGKRTNRAVYYDGKFHDLDVGQVHRVPFIHELNTDGTVVNLGFGVSAEQIYGLSIVSVRESCKDLVNWIFDLNSLNIRPILQSKNTNVPGHVRKQSRTRKRKKIKTQ